MTEDDSEIEDDFDEDDHDEENDDHALNALVKLADVIRKIRWFGYLGQPLDIETESLTQSYLGQLGFPDAFPIVVEDWEDAAFAAETTDHNSEAWEVEEQLRADLSQEALLYTDEAVLTEALDRITAVAGGLAMEAATSAASLWAVHDPQIIDIAAGHAVQSCYQAGLVLAAQAVEDHPFALKFQLFEKGRWPIALTGRSLHIF